MKDAARALADEVKVLHQDSFERSVSANAELYVSFFLDTNK